MYPDAFQSTQVPPPALNMMSFYPTMYPIPGLARPPLAPFPNAAIPAPPSFPANLYTADGPAFVPDRQGQGAISPPTNALFPSNLYGAGGPSFVPNYQGQNTIFPPANASFFPDTHDAGNPAFVPNYQGQGTIYPPANLPPPMFPTNNVYFQQPPFAGISSDATADFLPSSNGSPCKQPFPPVYQWPVPSQPGAAATQVQTLDQVAQDPFLMDPSQSAFAGISSDATADFLPSSNGSSCEQPAQLAYQWPVPSQPETAATQVQTLDQVAQDPFVMDPSQSPFAGISSDATADFLPSPNGSSCEQPARLVYQWPVPSQPEATATQVQTLDQVAQDTFVTDPSQGSGSLHGGNYQGTVASQATPPAPEDDQRKNHIRFHPPAEAKISKKKRRARTCWNVVGGPPILDTLHQPHTRPNPQKGQQLYYCELCDTWVPVHRKRYHDVKHSPETGAFVCKMCEIIGRPCEPCVLVFWFLVFGSVSPFDRADDGSVRLSRKDALKRHVDKKHPDYVVLLADLDLNILVPRKKNAHEDLGVLRQAMHALKPLPSESV